MTKETSNNFINILFVFFLALVVAYPVSLFIKNRSDLSNAITQEQRQAFISDEEVAINVQNNLDTLSPGERIGEGYKSVSYSNDGSAIIRVTLNNVANLTKEEFALVGSTPFSLLNTVRTNIKTPQVLEVVFNDDIIVNAFFGRETTQALINDPKILIEKIKNNDEEISDFLNHPAVKEALENKPVINVLAGSQLMANLLASPTGQYFLNNPQEVKTLINQNEDLKAISQNENLRYLLLNFEPTKQAAAIALN